MKVQESEKSNVHIINSIPLTIERLKDLSKDLKISHICRKCDLNYNSLKTKLYKLNQLTQEESEKISKYLESRNILVFYKEFGKKEYEES